MAHHHANNKHDYSAANQKRFDQKARTYDDIPQARELAMKIGNVIKTSYPSLFDKEHTTLIDYACGTGLMSRELYPHVKSVIGLDLSQGMVDQYNSRAANLGIPPERMRAMQMVLKGDGTELDGSKFDLIVCTVAYHHFTNIGETTRILASFIKPGGSLIIADILKNPEATAILAAHHDVVSYKSGFSQDEIRRTFEGAGLSEFGFTHAAQMRLHQKKVTVFVAKGTKSV